jgi:transcriptional regulator with XRE-family HTH domain
MGKTTAPPLDGEAIRQARHDRFLTQAEVAEQVAALVKGDDIKFDRSGLSLIENGTVKRPSLKVVRALAQVLGREALGPLAAAMVKDGGGEEDAPEGVAGAGAAALDELSPGGRTPGRPDNG